MPSRTGPHPSSTGQHLKSNLGDLRLLNRLLADVATGAQIADLSHGFESALNRLEAVDSDAKKDSLADRMIRLYTEQSERAIVAQHVELVELVELGPLFIREMFVRVMRQNAGVAALLLFVTGGRAAIAKQGTYWTDRKRRELAEVHSWIEGIVCDYSPKGGSLHLVIAD